MKKRIIYGILKTYKGIFTKKHIGNVHLLIIEMDKEFFLLNLVGQLSNGNEICQLLLRANLDYAEEFIDVFEKNEHFIQLEEIFCEIPNQHLNNFKVLLKKKGKYINSHLEVKFSEEYSTGNIKMYEIKGKFNLVFDDYINNSIQANIMALKKQTISKPLLSNFLSMIKR